MTISFQCPQCGKQHKVKGELAGKQAKCRCGSKVKIPSPRPAATAVPAAASIAVTCTGCGAVHQADSSLAGAKVQCPCGAVLDIPQMDAATPVGNAVSDGEFAAAAGAASGTDPEWDDDDFALQPAPAPMELQSGRSEDEVLQEFADRGPTLEEKQVRIQELTAARKLAAMDDGSDDSLEESLMNLGSVGGVVVMVLAAGWFLLGLKAGVIFFYPPVLFVLGLVAFFGGLNDFF